MSACRLLPQFTKVTSMKDALRRSMKAVQRQCSSVRKASLVQLSRNFWGVQRHFWGVHQACHLLLVVFVFLPGHDSLIKTVRSLEGDLADHNLATDKQRAPSHAVVTAKTSRDIENIQLQSSSKPFFGICQSDRLNGIEVASVWVWTTSIPCFLRVFICFLLMLAFQIVWMILGASRYWHQTRGSASHVHNHEVGTWTMQLCHCSLLMIMLHWQSV